MQRLRKAIHAAESETQGGAGIKGGDCTGLKGLARPTGRGIMRLVPARPSHTRLSAGYFRPLCWRTFSAFHSSIGCLVIRCARS